MLALSDWRELKRELAEGVTVCFSVDFERTSTVVTVTREDNPTYSPGFPVVASWDACRNGNGDIRWTHAKTLVSAIATACDELDGEIADFWTDAEAA